MTEQFNPNDPKCPVCGKDMWDNQEGKKNPKQPDFKCKDENCRFTKDKKTGEYVVGEYGTGVWLPKTGSQKSEANFKAGLNQDLSNERYLAGQDGQHQGMAINNAVAMFIGGKIKKDDIEATANWLYNIQLEQEEKAPTQILPKEPKTKGGQQMKKAMEEVKKGEEVEHEDEIDVSDIPF